MCRATAARLSVDEMRAGAGSRSAFLPKTPRLRLGCLAVNTYIIWRHPLDQKQSKTRSTAVAISQMRVNLGSDWHAKPVDVCDDGYE